MYIERILCPIVSLGPGRRLVIWTKGCTKNCKNCVSPEMKDVKSANNVKVEDLLVIIGNIYKSEGFDGITISGGDPLEQLPELVELVKALRDYTDDILVYTGFVWEEYKNTISEDIRVTLENTISVLIDGPYIDELNDSSVVLRGSSNQKIIFFDHEKEDIYSKYLSEGRKLQNVYLDSKLYSVGIFDR